MSLATTGAGRSKGQNAATDIVFCTFNDADGTSLDAYSWLNPGDVRPGPAQWVEGAGNWDIQGGKAREAATATTWMYATIETGVDDIITITASVTLADAANSYVGVCFRYADGDNLFRFALSPDRGAATVDTFLVQRVGAAQTILASVEQDWVAGSIHALKVTLLGQIISCYVDDMLMFTVNTALNIANTIHGLAGYNTAAHDENWRLDDFRVAPTSSQVLATPAATALADMPIAVDQHGFEECGGLLYVVGGEIRVSGTSGNGTYAYDPVANSWSTLAVLPIAVQSPILRSVGGKLYLIGGLRHADMYYSPKCYEYDPALDTWTEKADMPTGREDMGSAVVDGKIYVFGGLSAGPTPLTILEVYDPATDTWDETKADLPVAKQLGDFGAACNGKIYAIGATNVMTGYPALIPVVTVYEYDPSLDTWTAVANMPRPRCYKEVAPIGNRLYVVCGAFTSTTDVTDTIWAYDTISNGWLGGAIAPYSARGVSLAEYNGSIYMSGGCNAAGALVASLYRLDF